MSCPTVEDLKKSRQRCLEELHSARLGLEAAMLHAQMAEARARRLLAWRIVYPLIAGVAIGMALMAVIFHTGS